MFNVAVFHGTAVVLATGNPMSTRWEYKVLDSRVMNFFQPSLDGDALTSHLNELGAQGWEVVSMTSMEMGTGRTRDVVLVLKRPAG